jgi:putative membrane protein
MKAIWSFLLYVVAIFAAGYILPGVRIKSITTAAVIAVLLSVASFTIKPILKFITFPINFLTLGLFTWVIDAFILVIIDKLLEDFEIDGFLWAIIYAVVLAATNGLLHIIF